MSASATFPDPYKEPQGAPHSRSDVNIPNAYWYQISGGTHNATRSGDIIHNYGGVIEEYAGLKILREHVSSGAFHNSAERFDPPKCHPRTREVVIQEIMDWVHDCTRIKPVIWMSGPAGAGKSSIAHTIADICKKEGMLAADFFFGRTAVGRNDASRFIATVLYQILRVLPIIRYRVSMAIELDPLIFSQSVEDQMETLILRPLREEGLGNQYSQTFLFIVDGLDECNQTGDRQRIVSMISSIAYQQCTPFVFLLTSRLDPVIRDAFNEDVPSSLTRRLVLNDDYQPDSDIRIFLQSKFDAINAKHPSRMSLPNPWPTHEEIEYLVRKSSGQFIYASTVIKFVESPHGLPTDRLNIVLGLHLSESNAPFLDLDALYSHIFQSVDNISKVMKTFSFLVFCAFPAYRTLSFVEGFLGFHRGELPTVLVDLHSIISVPEHSPSAEINILHASLFDFLRDKARSGNFYIDSGPAHSLLVECCLRVVADVHNAPDSALVMYSIYYLESHLTQANPTPELLKYFLTYDFSKYIRKQLEQYHGVDIIVLMDNIMRWLQKINDSQLIDKVTADFDKWFSTSLVQYFRVAQIQHFLASMAVDGSLVRWKYLRKLLLKYDRVYSIREEVDEEEFCTNFGLDADTEEPETSILVYGFFIDPTRSGKYFVDTSAFVSFAKFLCSLLRRKPPFNDQREIEVVYMCALTTLPLVLKRVALERELAQFLANCPIPMKKRFRRMETLFTATSSSITAYIEEFNVYASLTKQQEIKTAENNQVHNTGRNNKRKQSAAVDENVYEQLMKKNRKPEDADD